MTLFFRKDDPSGTGNLFERFPAGGSRRILAVWFPHLSSDRILRRRHGAEWRQRKGKEGQADFFPLIISHRQDNAQRIAALDEQAEALGLKPGMGVADARAMHPQVEIIEADPDADRRLLESLADWCDRFTPLVALDGDDGLFLDISGCAHLFGGEDAMLDEIVHRLSGQGFDVRAGLASTPGMAWAAARYCRNDGRKIPAGGEGHALAPLPLSALRIEEKVEAALGKVGLYRVGSLLDAPRAPLSRRFGRQLMSRLDQALGIVEEAISPRLPVAPLSVERRLAEPIGTLEDIERLLLLLAQSLKQDLERRGQGARRLDLSLFRVDGAVTRIMVGTARPLREPQAVSRLFHERLTALENDLDPGYGFDLLRLSVAVAMPFSTPQADLSGQSCGEEKDLSFFADRICARLGNDAVLAPFMTESHMPERRGRFTPLGENAFDKPSKAASPHDRRPTSSRPIRLLERPEPVEASAEVPEGPPLSFRWRKALYRVARAEGPERIASEWWHEDVPASVRDYFRIEDSEGRRYWLYREGLYGEAAQPRWFLHGIFP